MCCTNSLKQAKAVICGHSWITCAGNLVEAEELVMPKEGTYSRPAAVERVDRPAGQNNVGMVAWLLVLKTPECPQGRQVSSPVRLIENSAL